MPNIERGQPTYTVMVESTERPGAMTRASGQYVQRGSAFKRARKLAKQTGRRVTVWEYDGPGASHVHQLDAR